MVNSILSLKTKDSYTFPISFELGDTRAGNGWRDRSTKWSSNSESVRLGKSDNEVFNISFLDKLLCRQVLAVKQSTPFKPGTTEHGSGMFKDLKGADSSVEIQHQLSTVLSELSVVAELCRTIYVRQKLLQDI